VSTPGNVRITYAYGGGVAMGNTMRARDTRQLPIDVSWPARTDRFYTLMMLRECVRTDACERPDPNPSGRSNEDFLHWLVVNIPGCAVRSGRTLADYVPPFPVPNTRACARTSPHTNMLTALQAYVFLVYEQAVPIYDMIYINCFTRQGREYGQWNTQAFVQRNSLSTPAAANYFYVGFVYVSYFLHFQVDCDNSVREITRQLGMPDQGTC
jgi:hypothetical protein